jgi:hypothetical protein
VIFDHLKLFRILDFEFRTLFVLGVLMRLLRKSLFFGFRLNQPFIARIETQLEPATDA